MWMKKIWKNGCNMPLSTVSHMAETLIIVLGIATVMSSEVIHISNTEIINERSNISRQEKYNSIPYAPTIVEGDVATDIEENLFRLGIRWDIFPHKRWKNNTINYLIDPIYGPREYLLIERAIKTFDFLSCINFEVWDGVQEDYLHIEPSKERPGCWSYMGRKGGKQTLSLRPPDETKCHCLCDVGRTLHEMMHALGFYHEHSRPDRDSYIDIIEENVKEGRLANFEKKTFDTTVTDFDYDYNSIMHYSPFSFSRDKANKKVTVKPLQKNAKIGQRIMLSQVDCMKLNHHYGCFDTSNLWENNKIRVKCSFLGFKF